MEIDQCRVKQEIYVVVKTGRLSVCLIFIILVDHWREGNVRHWREGNVRHRTVRKGILGYLQPFVKIDIRASHRNKSLVPVDEQVCRY